MSVFIVSGSNAPENTHLIIGQFRKSNGDEIELDININDILDPVKKVAYTDFFNLVGSFVSIELINSPYMLDCNHITPEFVAEEAIVIDYAALSANDKVIVDTAFGLLEAL